MSGSSVQRLFFLLLQETEQTVRVRAEMGMEKMIEVEREKRGS
jgi:hypothetical protein